MVSWLGGEAGVWSGSQASGWLGVWSVGSAVGREDGRAGG